MSRIRSHVCPSKAAKAGRCSGAFMAPIGNPDVPQVNGRVQQAPKPPRFTLDTRVGLMPTGPISCPRNFGGRDTTVAVQRGGTVVKIVPGLSPDEANQYVAEFNRLNAHLGLTARLAHQAVQKPARARGTADVAVAVR
jgi:hypothetical protein